MITVENLSFTYRKSKRVVLHDFSLAFESGRVYGLLGKNGAGKSTLLYLMSGLLTPKGGKVMFHDTDVRRRLPVTLQDMFLVPEEFELPPVSLVSYIELNSSFYPRFSKEDMIKYLHAIPTIQGNYLILPNKEKEESDINLELLFNATLAAPEEMARLFQTQK